MQQRFTFFLLIVLVFSPLQIADATTSHISKMDAYKMLRSGHSDIVRTLPKGEREILLATFEMNRGKTTEALKHLNSKQVKKNNRLAALIKAEAYRRQSVQAADRAGHYAHAVNGDIGMLKKARITTGLDEANVRLDAFLVRLNTPKPVAKIPPKPVKPIRVAVLEHVTPLKPQPVKIALARPAPIAARVVTAKAVPAAVLKPVVSYQPVVVAPQPVKIALAKPAPIPARVVTVAKVVPAAVSRPVVSYQSVVVAPKPVKIALVKPAPIPTRTVTVAQTMPAVVSRPVVKVQPVVEARQTVIAAQPSVVALLQPLSEAHRDVKVDVIEPKPVRLKLAQLEPSELMVFETTLGQKSVSSAPSKRASVGASMGAVQALGRLASVRQAVDAWRSDWSSLNSKAYLSHYDKAFKTLKHDYASWVKYKRRVNGKKTYIKVSISDMKIIPSSDASQDGDAVLVTFKQRYQSSNYNAVNRKQLYMARKNTASPWLILYEGDNS